MKIILSPAKKMLDNNDYFQYQEMPALIDKTKKLLALLQGYDQKQLKILWKCSDSLVEENMERIQRMDLHSNLTPAIFSYDGIAFKYLAADVMDEGQLAYLNDKLRILSGFYGILRPFDGVKPYRLEMQAKLCVGESKDLYEYWSNSLYEQINDDIIINLASEEYSKCISKYLKDTDRFVTVEFVENVKGKLVTKGTIAKMARGEMVRFMVENKIENVEQIKEFQRLGFSYREDLSDEQTIVFEKR